MFLVVVSGVLSCLLGSDLLLTGLTVSSVMAGSIGYEFEAGFAVSRHESIWL